jgi:hypothetical protein
MRINLLKIVEHVGVGIAIYCFTAREITRQIIEFNTVMFHRPLYMGRTRFRISKSTKDILTDMFNVLSVNLQVFVQYWSSEIYLARVLHFVYPTYVCRGVYLGDSVVAFTQGKIALVKMSCN